MNKFIVIEGRVLGGHTIEDLGITVPYLKSITIEATRAGWSRDLTFALSNGMVEKVKVITGESRITNPSRPTKKSRPTPKKHTTKPASRAAVEDSSPSLGRPEVTDIEIPTEIGLSERSEALLQKSLEENQKLRAEYSELRKTTDALISKLGDFLENPVQVAPNMPATQSSGAYVVEDDAPAFIPSQIRTGTAKTNKDVDVSTESSGGSANFDDAAKALAAMRKGKRKKDD